MIQKTKRGGEEEEHTHHTDALAPNSNKKKTHTSISSPILDLSRFASHKIISTQIYFSYLPPG